MNDRHLGIKLVNVFPGNGRLGLPALSSTYTLSDGQTGQVRAIIDGETLTARRTAAIAALGASYLAAPGGQSPPGRRRAYRARVARSVRDGTSDRHRYGLGETA